MRAFSKSSYFKNGRFKTIVLKNDRFNYDRFYKNRRFVNDDHWLTIVNDDPSLTIVKI